MPINVNRGGWAEVMLTQTLKKGENVLGMGFYGGMEHNIRMCQPCVTLDPRCNVLRDY